MQFHRLARGVACLIGTAGLVGVPTRLVFAADCTPNPTGVNATVTGGCNLPAATLFTVSTGSTLTATDNTTLTNSWTIANAPSLLNNGTITSVNTPGTGTMAFYNSGTLTSLVNNGVITAPSYYVLANQGTITSLINTGSMTGSNGITNYGTIGTLTNTGTMSSIRGDLMGRGSIGTLNNLQGAGNPAGALRTLYTPPVSYNLIAYSPSSYGQLAITNLRSGTMAFNVYGNTGTTLVNGVSASVLSAGTYAGVLQGFLTLSNVTGTSGTYGRFAYSLVAGSQTGYWDLVVTATSTNMLSRNTYLSSDLGSSVNPVFAGGTLRIANAGQIARALSLQNSGGTIDQNGLASIFSGNITNISGETQGRLIIANSGAAGQGSVTLSGVNTYTGGTEVQAGAVLQITSGDALGSGRLDLIGSDTVPATLAVTSSTTINNPITVAGDPVFNIAPGTTTTVNGVIADGAMAGDVVVEGGGTLNLTAANTYTGPTTVSAGTLNLTGSLASTAVTVAGGTLIDANGGLSTSTNLTVNSGTANIDANQTIAHLNGTGGGVALASGKTLTVSAGGAYAGTISGAGGLRVSGGTQTLSGDNTYTGGTEVDAGATLSISSANALGTGTLALVGTSTVSATLQTTATMTVANAITVKNDPTFDVANGTTTTLSGVIADGGAAGYVTKIGGGTLLLTAANTYSGPTTIDVGTLALSGAGSISASTAVTNNATLDVTQATGNVALGGTYVQGANGTLKMTMAPLANQQVNVAGTASLGGTLSLAAAAGTYRTGRYTLLTSAGLGASTFAAFNTNLASVTPYTYRLAYGANDVYLDLLSSAADTTRSILALGSDLNKVYNAQYGMAQLGLSYDCKLFAENNLCLSIGARTTHSRADGTTYDGAALIAAYRVQPNVRVGAWIDQNESRKSTLNVTAGNGTPMFGAFAVWNAQPQTGEGLEVKVSAAYGQKDLTLTRPVSGTSERGQGNSRLSTLVAEARVGYDIRLDERTSLSPFAGLRHADLSNTGYTEASDVFSPLAFAQTRQSANSVIAGVNLYDKPEGPIGLDLSAGVEHFVNTRAAQLSATGIDNLSAVQMTPALSTNRPFASATLRHDLARNQHLLFGLSHTKQFTNSDWVSSATVRYVIGL